MLLEAQRQEHASTEARLTADLTAAREDLTAAREQLGETASAKAGLEEELVAAQASAASAAAAQATSEERCRLCANGDTL